VKIKGSSWDEIKHNQFIEGSGLAPEQHSEIERTEWASSKTDWNKSVLYGPEFSYFWVNVDVDQMLAAFPIPNPLHTGSAKRLGDNYITDEQVFDGDTPKASRGRPPLPWEPFHVEVALLYKNNELPQKKEAAIAHFQDWFRENFGVSASRSAIGQKLTPYYDKLFRS
jgi:hypothetical protein